MLHTMLQMQATVHNILKTVANTENIIARPHAINYVKIHLSHAQKYLPFLRIIIKYSHETQQILDLPEGDYALSDRTRAKLTDTTLLIYSEVTREQSDEYAAMINSPLENGIHEQEELERETSDMIRGMWY